VNPIKFDEATINNYCECLSRDAVELIDFDTLQELLKEMAPACKRLEKMNAELMTIKDDYRNRIVGMLKANLACRKDPHDMELAASLAGDLEQIEAGELVRLYSRVAGRFRSNFPASFKYLTFRTAAGPQKDWTEHKI
jgi:hypothetical protein